MDWGADGRTGEWTDGWTVGRTYERVDGQTDGRADGKKDGWARRMDLQVNGQVTCPSDGLGSDERRDERANRWIYRCKDGRNGRTGDSSIWRMVKWTDGGIDGWVNSETAGRSGRWNDGQSSGRTFRRTSERMNGRQGLNNFEILLHTLSLRLRDCGRDQVRGSPSPLKRVRCVLLEYMNV